MTTEHTSTDQMSLPPGTWQIDPAATTITVSAKHLFVTTVPATLNVTSGVIQIDDSGKVVNVEVVSDAGSYASKNAKRNEHVVGPDFLDGANHPTITFRTGAAARAAGGYRADGRVTIKGQVAPISVAITDVETSATTSSFNATATVDRRALGVDKLPSLVIGNELHLSVSATAKLAS